MPLFYTPKPRQFHYTPRFYDPEKEEWEALKKKYAMKQEAEARAKQAPETETEVDYFERRLKELDRKEKKSGLGINDLFRKREMPKFNYTPRFSGSATATASEASNAEVSSQDESLTEKYRQAKHQIKIRRRFDISDTDYMKPVSGTKIILYCFIVFLLITLIISF